MLLVRSLNHVAIALIDAGGMTAYLAVLERCLVLAREQHLLPELREDADQPRRGALSERPRQGCGDE